MSLRIKQMVPLAAIFAASSVSGFNTAPAFVPPTGLLASRTHTALNAASVSKSIPDRVMRETSSTSCTPQEETMSRCDAYHVRNMLKAAILERSELFNEKTSAVEKKKRRKKTKDAEENPGKFRRLVRRIAAPFSKVKDDSSEESSDRLKGLLAADAPVPGMVNLGHEGLEVVRLAERLAEYNPTDVPTYGWQGYNGGQPKDSPLDGTWKLRFTTAKDATFRDDPVRGKVTTSQEVNAEKGTLTNVINFEKGKLEGFRVVVAGEAKSKDEIDLTFKRVVIKRNSRFPRFFGNISIPIPSFRFLRALTRFASRGKEVANRAYFNVKYVDEDFRMHKTGDGNWFIQTRIK